MEFSNQLRPQPRRHGWGKFVEEKARKYIYPFASRAKFFAAMARPYESEPTICSGDFMSEKDEWHSCSSYQQSSSHQQPRIRTTDNYDSVEAFLRSLDDMEPQRRASEDTISYRTATLYTQSNVRICEFEGQYPETPNNLTVSTCIQEDCELREILPPGRESRVFFEDEPAVMGYDDPQAVQRSVSTACIRRKKRSKRKRKQRAEVDANAQENLSKRSNERLEETAVVEEATNYVGRAQDAASQTAEGMTAEAGARRPTHRQAVITYNQVLHDLENVVKAIAYAARRQENVDESETETAVAAASAKRERSVKAKKQLTVDGSGEQEAEFQLAAPSMRTHHNENLDKQESQPAVCVSSIKTARRDKPKYKLKHDSVDEQNERAVAVSPINNDHRNNNYSLHKMEPETAAESSSKFRNNVRKSNYKSQHESSNVEEPEGQTVKSEWREEDYNSNHSVEARTHNAIYSMSGTSQKSKLRDHRTSSQKSSEKEATHTNNSEFANYSSERVNYNAEPLDYNAEQLDYNVEEVHYNADDCNQNAEPIDYNAGLHNNDAESVDYNTGLANYNAALGNYNTELVNYNADLEKLPADKTALQANENSQQNDDALSLEKQSSNGKSPRKIVIRIAIKNRKEPAALETRAQETQTERTESKTSTRQSSCHREMVSKFTQHSNTSQKLKSEQEPNYADLMTLLAPQMTRTRCTCGSSSHKSSGLSLAVKEFSSASSVGEYDLKSVPKSMSLTSGPSNNPAVYSQAPSSARISGYDEYKHERRSERNDSVKSVSFRSDSPVTSTIGNESQYAAKKSSLKVSPARMQLSTPPSYSRWLAKKSSRDARRQFLPNCWWNSPKLIDELGRINEVDYESPANTSAGTDSYRQPPKSRMQPMQRHFIPTEFSYPMNDSRTESSTSKSTEPSRFSRSADAQRQQPEDQTLPQTTYTRPVGRSPSLSLLLSSQTEFKPRNSTQNYVLSLSLEEYLRSKLVMPRLRALHSANYSILQRNNEMMDGILNLPERIAGIFESADGVD